MKGKQNLTPQRHTDRERHTHRHTHKKRERERPDPVLTSTDLLQPGRVRLTLNTC